MITLSGMVGYEITSQQVADSLAELDGKEAEFEIETPGGLVSEGIAIYNRIKNYPGRVKMNAIGDVSSMGTYVMAAADERTAEDNVTWLIHNPRNLAVGDYQVMEENSKHLKALAKILARVYSDVTGKDINEIQSLMDKETYYYGEEIKDAGFVHSINDRGGKNDDESKASAIASAQLAVADCIERIKQDASAQSDIQRAAAMIGDMPTKKKSDGRSSDNPAPAGSKEGTQMPTLQDVMQGDPAIKAEVDALTAKARNDGADAVEARIKKAEAYLDSKYPAAIRTLAAKVVKGEEEPAALVGAVAMFDAMAEKEKEEKDAKDQGGDTPAQGDHNNASEDGQVKSQDDYNAAIARVKGEGGDK